MTEHPGKKITDIVDKMRPHLADLSAGEQGAALAELTAIWIAGHPEPIRTKLVVAHLKATCNSVELHAAINDGTA